MESELPSSPSYQDHMKLVVCHGRTTVEQMMLWLGPEKGLRRPYRVCTMDAVWWEVAAHFELPRCFFKDKLVMMRYCLTHVKDDKIIALVARDNTDDSAAMAASFHAMSAVDFTFNPDLEVEDADRE